MEYSGTSEEGHRIASKVAIGWLGNDRIHDVLVEETLLVLQTYLFLILLLQVNLQHYQDTESQTAKKL